MFANSVIKKITRLKKEFLFEEREFFLGRGSAVNFRKICGEMLLKLYFHRLFLTSFCGECNESR